MVVKDNDEFGLALLGVFAAKWLNGDYDGEGCCLGCVVYVVAGVVGVGLVLHLLW